MDSTQAHLLTQLKQRDPNALAALFDQYANPVHRLALRLLHDSAQADDVVQNTFLALIKHIDHFEGRARIHTWLYRVAYNDAMMRLRSRPGAALEEDDGPEMLPAALSDWKGRPEDVLAQTEAVSEMDRAIAALSPRLRAVFTLRDVDELSTHETAEALGLSESAVKVSLHRARLALREQLSAYFIERRGNHQEA